MYYSSLGQYFISAVWFIWKLRLINSSSENKQKLCCLNWLYSQLLPSNCTPTLKIATVPFHTHTQQYHTRCFQCRQVLCQVVIGGSVLLPVYYQHFSFNGNCYDSNHFVPIDTKFLSCFVRTPQKIQNKPSDKYFRPYVGWNINKRNQSYNF
jgi:hypothetical protein